MRNDITIASFKGAELRAHLPCIARLRLEVFQDYPYLYKGDKDFEIEYLQRHSESEEAIGVLVFDGSTLVGASTGIPMDQEVLLFQKPFTKTTLSSIFFLSDSVLLKQYRGRGIAHHFFDLREAHAKNLGRFSKICFCTPEYKENDPQRPEDFLPLTDFWKKRGYILHPDKAVTLSWKNLATACISEKVKQFWIKEL